MTDMFIMNENKVDSYGVPQGSILPSLGSFVYNIFTHNKYIIYRYPTIILYIQDMFLYTFINPMNTWIYMTDCMLCILR